MVHIGHAGANPTAAPVSELAVVSLLFDFCFKYNSQIIGTGVYVVVVYLCMTIKFESVNADNRLVSRSSYYPVFDCLQYVHIQLRAYIVYAYSIHTYCK